jgi:hypothetical protein
MLLIIVDNVSTFFFLNSRILSKILSMWLSINNSFSPSVVSLMLRHSNEYSGIAFYNYLTSFVWFGMLIYYGSITVKYSDIWVCFWLLSRSFFLLLFTCLCLLYSIIICTKVRSLHTSPIISYPLTTRFPKYIEYRQFVISSLVLVISRYV